MDEEYKLYLQSEAWKEKASRIKSEKKYRCEICGNYIVAEVIKVLRNPYHPSSSIPDIARFTEVIAERGSIEHKERLFDAHHLSYQRVGCELDEDLACLCKPCHVFFHENADKYGWDKSWEMTVNQVKEILKKVRSQPINHLETDQMAFFEELSFHTEPDPDLIEAAEDYYGFLREFYRTQESFGYPRE